MGVGEGDRSDSARGWANSLETRLVAAVPVHPALTGLGLAAALLAGYLAVDQLSGEAMRLRDEPSVAGLRQSVLGFALAAVAAGYALAVGYLINAGNAAALEALRPALGSPAADAAGAAGAAGGSLERSRMYGALGVLLGLLFVYAVDPAAADLMRMRAWSIDGLLSVVLLPLAFFLFLRAAYFTIAGTAHVAREVEAHLAIDPLDPRPFLPLGRVALRGSLLWIGTALLASLSILLSEGGAAEVTAMFFGLGVGAASFYIPMRPVHRRLQQAKYEELGRVRAEIRRDREAVAALGADAAEAAARLPGLLAFETRIQTVREWPLDASTLVRFALYLAIPVASWLGGAFVERLVDAVLD